MKSILYVGATLMIGASIYGFVDYKKTKNHKEFTNMYKEADVAEPTPVAESKTVLPAEKKVTLVKEKNKPVKKLPVQEKKSIETNEITNRDRPVAETITPGEIKVIENTEVTVTPPNEDVKNKIVTKKKRKLSTKLFSRGALDERYIDEEKIKPEEPKVKTEPERTGKK